MPVASQPWISKGDSPLNNSFQWEPSEPTHRRTHACRVLSHTQMAASWSRMLQRPYTKHRLLILLFDEYLQMDEETLSWNKERTFWWNSDSKKCFKVVFGLWANITEKCIQYFDKSRNYRNPSPLSAEGFKCKFLKTFQAFVNLIKLHFSFNRIKKTCQMFELRKCIWHGHVYQCAGYTLDRLPDCHRANTDRHSYLQAI